MKYIVFSISLFISFAASANFQLSPDQKEVLKNAICPNNLNYLKRNGLNPSELSERAGEMPLSISGLYKLNSALLKGEFAVIYDWEFNWYNLINLNKPKDMGYEQFFGLVNEFPLVHLVDVDPEFNDGGKITGYRSYFLTPSSSPVSFSAELLLDEQSPQLKVNCFEAK